MVSPEGYSKQLQILLKQMHAKIGDRVAVAGCEGRLMPRVNGDRDALVLKLDNGYNIGVKPGRLKLMGRNLKAVDKPLKAVATADRNKPTIAILHTGGTIASRLDYRTGAVEPVITDSELISMYPELTEIANIRSRVVFQAFSEDLEPVHWSMLAKNVHDEIKKGCDGVVITHGTDTMYYTASALSFALQNLDKPVILVASQRSSDRPSSDAGVNLTSAAYFIAESDYAGVGICMHKTPSDDKCWILEANKARKMHTSRRDTYRPVNSVPLAEVDWKAGSIRFLKSGYPKKSGKLQLKEKFSDKVGLVKVYPGFAPELLDVFARKYKGLVIEGYAFGQMPVNSFDKNTLHHAKMLEKLGKMSKRMPVVVASQLPYGVVNMNVYSTSRDLVKAGVIPAYMQAYAAYVKLSWLLGNRKKLDDIRKTINEDVAGEIVTRQEIGEFPDEDLEKM